MVNTPPAPHEPTPDILVIAAERLREQFAAIAGTTWGPSNEFTIPFLGRYPATIVGEAYRATALAIKRGTLVLGPEDNGWQPYLRKVANTMANPPGPGSFREAASGLAAAALEGDVLCLCGNPSLNMCGACIDALIEPPRPPRLPAEQCYYCEEKPANSRNRPGYCRSCARVAPY